MTKKTPLLFCVHRLPYPPNKGDKIRSFHILKHISKSYDVYLATFIDDANDEQYVETVRQFCKNIYVERIDPLLRKIRVLPYLLGKQSLSVPYYQSKSMSRWINGVVQEQNIGIGMAYSSSMAQFLMPFKQMKKIIDFVDVDSDKWRQYAEHKSGVSRWVYNREHKKLAQYEGVVANIFQYSFLVSQTEAKLMQNQQGLDDDKVGYFNNGVDLKFFDPKNVTENPLSSEKINVVFTGAMDYWANVDAVKWFCQHILPRLKQAVPNIHFSIVGSNPTKEVLALANETITVTGRVKDIRAYIKFANLAVAPMQIARGIQNKVLEALALNQTVVMTPMAYEGLFETEELSRLTHEKPDDFLHCCLAELEEKNENSSWRDYIVEHYSWDNCLSLLDAKLN